MKTKNTKTAKQRLELVKNDGGSQGMSAMFKSSGGLSPGMKVKSRSPLLKPDKFPENQLLSGIFKRIITAHVGKGDDGEDKAGALIEIVPDMNAVGITIPAVATIATALELTHTGEGRETVFHSPFLGHRLEIQKLPERIPSRKGQAAWNFLVAISEEAVVELES
jgi:hypothetical protein